MNAAALVALQTALSLSQNAAAPQPGGQFAVQIGLFSYRADGTNGAFATTGGTAGNFEGNVYAAGGCSLGAGGRDAPTAAGNVWRVSGHIVEMTADSAVVDLQWARVKDGGQPASLGMTQRLALQAMNPVVIDSAFVTPDGKCDVVRVALEARLAPRMSGHGFAGAHGGGSGIGTGSGSGSGGGTASQSGVTVWPSSGTGGSPGGTAGGGRGVVRNDEPMYDVDLWLVRQPPGGDETAIPTRLRVNNSGGSFTFPPVRVSNSHGEAVVTIAGAFRVVGAEDARQLTFSTSRIVRVAWGQVSDRDQQATSGSSQTTVPLPGPDEVLSFEMPRIKSPEFGDFRDQFSVRLRVRPIQ